MASEPAPPMTQAPTVAPSPSDEELRSIPRPGPLPRRLRFFLVGACGAGLVVFLNAVSWRAFGGNSDDANALLAGHALVHGNVLLHGWQLPTDSYWSVDLPLYGIASLVTGVGQSLLHIVPSAIAAAVVLAAVVLAVRDAPPARRWAAGATTLAIVGLPAPLLASFFLQGPMHIATTLYCLLAFLLIDPARFGWRWWAGVGLLGAAVAGDPVAVAIGAAPLAAARLVAGRRNGSWRASVSPLAAAATSVAAAGALRWVLPRLGGYTSAPALPLSPAGNWGANLRAVPERLGALLGVTGPSPHVWATGRWVHDLGLVALAVGVAVASFALLRAAVASRSSALRPGPEQGGWNGDLLTLATWGSLGAFVAITLPHADVNSVRYLVPAVVFGSVLAGRSVARLRVSSMSSVGVKLAALALLAAYAATPWAVATGPRPPAPPQALARWLAGNHLRHGFGPYWDASVVTVSSQDGAQVRPVIAEAGRLHALAYFASADWFKPSAPPPADKVFLVYEPAQPWGGVDDASAAGTFGPPERVAAVGPYRVLVWPGEVASGLGPLTTLPS